MHFAHPFRVALGEIVVDGDDMHALSRKRVEVSGKSGDERLAFARAHLRDSALMQTDAADDLHVKVLHAQNAPRRFPERRKRVGENVVQRFARRQSVFQNRRLPFERVVVHSLVLTFEHFHLIGDLVQLFQAFSAVAAHQKTD